MIHWLFRQRLTYEVLTEEKSFTFFLFKQIFHIENKEYKMYKCTCKNEDIIEGNRNCDFCLKEIKIIAEKNEFIYLLHENKLPEEELANKMRISTPTIHRWKNGKNLPHRGMIPIINKFLRKLNNEQAAALSKK